MSFEIKKTDEEIQFEETKRLYGKIIDLMMKVLELREIIQELERRVAK